MSDPDEWGANERGRGGEDDDWEDDEEDDLLVELVVFGVLGAGFVAMFLGMSEFWMIWVLGFAVLLPIVGLLSKHYGPFLGKGKGKDSGRGRSRSRTARGRDRSEEEDALEALKRRYAEGEIDEAEFERRLERLVENEDIDDARRRVRETREREREREYEYER